MNTQDKNAIKDSIYFGEFDEPTNEIPKIFKPPITLTNLMKGHSTFWYLRYYYEIATSADNSYQLTTEIDLLKDSSNFIKCLSWLSIFTLTISIYLILRFSYCFYRFFKRPSLKYNTNDKIKRRREKIDRTGIFGDSY
jgi:hypothetical protein